MEITVYNTSQNQHETISMGQVIEIGRKLVDEYPLNNMLWYPAGFMTPNKTVYWLLFLFLHLLPALFVDSLLKLVGEKPM